GPVVSFRRQASQLNPATPNRNVWVQYATGFLAVIGLGLALPYVLRYAMPARPISFIVSAVTGGSLGASVHLALAYLIGVPALGAMLSAPSFGVAVASFLILNRGKREPRPEFRPNEPDTPSNVTAAGVFLLDPANAAFLDG